MKRYRLLVIIAIAILVVIALQQCAPDDYGIFISPIAYHLYLPLIISGHTNHKGVGATYFDCEGIEMVGATWYYNWSANPPLCVEAVPMIWDEEYVGDTIGGNSEWLMGPNECEMEGQCGLSPRDTAILWREIEGLYPGKRLVSPSTLSISWLTRWWNEYVAMYGETPRVDAISLHCYGNSTTWDGAVAYCKSMTMQAINWGAARDIHEVWVTEFGFLPCWQGEDKSVLFMDAMVEFFEREPAVTRYAWFQLAYRGDEPWSFGPLCNTSLVDYWTGEITLLGEAYHH